MAFRSFVRSFHLRGVAESGEAERSLSPTFLGEIYDNIEARPIEMLLEPDSGAEAKDGANPEEEAGDPGAFGEAGPNSFSSLCGMVLEV